MKETCRYIRRAGLGLGFGILIGLVGCISTPGGASSEVHLSLTAVGTIMMDGKVIRRDDLPRIIKTAGAGPATPIIVSTEAATPMPAISALTSQLATAGYGCVIFKRPRHAEATVIAKPGH